MFQLKYRVEASAPVITRGVPPLQSRVESRGFGELTTLQYNTAQLRVMRLSTIKLSNDKTADRVTPLSQSATTPAITFSLVHLSKVVNGKPPTMCNLITK